MQLPAELCQRDDREEATRRTPTSGPESQAFTSAGVVQSAAVLRQQQTQRRALIQPQYLWLPEVFRFPW